MSLSLMIGKNVLLALLLSLALTLALAVVYTFYPLISAILSIVWQGIASTRPQTGGIGAVAGGFSGASLKTLVMVAGIIFLILLALLQKSSMKH